MPRRIRTSRRIVLPAVDLGGTKIALAFVETDGGRRIARRYPPVEVVRSAGRTHAERTLRRVAALIKRRTREVEQEGWTVLPLVGMGAPGLYRDDGSVDPRTVPNIPGLAAIKPARTLESMLGGQWKVYIHNDGVVQAVASAHALLRSPVYARKWNKTLRKGGGKIIYFGPGTGFGAGKVRVFPDGRVEPLPGSQAFFDILIRNGRTAEELIGGRGIGKIAALKERDNLKKGTPVFLRFTDGYGPGPTGPKRSVERLLAEITGKTVALAYGSRDAQAKRQATEIFTQVGRDLARLIIRLHTGRGRKQLLEWGRDDWGSVRGASLFLVAGLLSKPTGKKVILPALRNALRDAGYASRVHVVEIDRLAAMRGMQGKIGIWGASWIVPPEEVVAQKASRSLLVGAGPIHRHLGKRARSWSLETGRTFLLAVDGYAAVDWPRSVLQLRNRLEKDGFNVTTIDISAFYKPDETIEDMILPSLTDERTFGRVFHGRLLDFLDEERLEGLRARLSEWRSERQSSPRAILCFGTGAACAPLRGLYDLILYRDVTREEIAKRSSRGLLVPLGTRSRQGPGKGQPAYLAAKRFHYVDFPVLDKEKRSLLKHVDYYVDDNLPGQAKLISRDALDGLISHLVQGPFRLEAFHDEGVWGGQWLKKVRNLPKEMSNCAWAYELMAYQMSLRIPVAATYIELPFANILDRAPDRIIGPRVRRTFKGLWPIRVNYDDCWQGGDMAIQIHPDSPYIRRWFRESLRQDESYYIMAAAPDAYVYLGLKEGVDLKAFKQAVRRAETRRIPFDHRKYVNVLPAKEGDLFLIPAGTVHASGRGCVVLELSSTTDRYTFHFYDYLRPDLNGELREIHAAHAFRMLRKHPERTTGWVQKHLVQKPRCLRRGRDWAEFLLGRMEELVFEVRRLEFASRVEEDTRGVPHVLSVAQGKAVLIESRTHPGRSLRLGFSETALVPACMGEYSIQNLDGSPCKVLKTIVNPSTLTA